MSTHVINQLVVVRALLMDVYRLDCGLEPSTTLKLRLLTSAYV